MEQDDRSHDHVLREDHVLPDLAQAAGRSPFRPAAGSLVLARTPAPGVAALARLLAQAFLDASDWRREDLVDAGAYVLGARRRWLGPLVRSVLTGYPRRPAGAPRELSRWIAAQPALTDAVGTAAANSRPIAPSHVLPAAAAADATTAIPTAPTAPTAPTVVAAPTVPTVPTAPTAGGPGAHESRESCDLTWLARELRLTPGDLDWFADTRQRNRRAVPVLQHYRYSWRQRPGRVPRLLEVPGPRLRIVQRRLLDRILAPLPLHPAAHGFVRGRSALTGAALHTGADVVISLDLTAFFAHVVPGRIFGALRQAGYPEAAAHVLTGLTTHSVPDAVLRSMPDGGGPDERFALRRALRTAHLPQGAPSSPALANLAVRRLDARLTGYAEAAGGVYTRYADDLAFSGSADLARRADAFVRGVGRIVTAEGLSVNARKTRVRGSSVRQSVTGIVVNAHPNVARTEYDTLKAILHNCALHGPESQRRGRAEFSDHLAGRIARVSALNASRGEKLRDAFERISW
ncbi:reverse transcriptase family protein [Arthrobacter sp. N1]|uniref:reverse transcriptase family protein n=1 Tax=Arthrobacter sp. N1 TaxID=619291 RepID=UPI003BB1DAD6